MLVLDTNVVLDLLHFGDAAAQPLLHALEAGRVRCVVTDATLDEWRRVLAYPAFALDAARQAVLFARYVCLALPVVSVGIHPELPHKKTPIHDGLKPVRRHMPRCSDPDDQKFLELAAYAQAQILVSKDRALLKLRCRCAPDFQILTPAGAARWLSGQPACCG